MYIILTKAEKIVSEKGRLLSWEADQVEISVNQYKLLLCEQKKKMIHVRALRNRRGKRQITFIGKWQIANYLWY